jgi:hypothetical protein
MTDPIQLETTTVDIKYEAELPDGEQLLYAQMEESGSPLLSVDGGDTYHQVPVIDGGFDLSGTTLDIPGNQNFLRLHYGRNGDVVGCLEQLDSRLGGSGYFLLAAHELVDAERSLDISENQITRAPVVYEPLWALAAEDSSQYLLLNTRYGNGEFKFIHKSPDGDEQELPVSDYYDTYYASVINLGKGVRASVRGGVPVDHYETTKGTFEIDWHPDGNKYSLNGKSLTQLGDEAIQEFKIPPVEITGYETLHAALCTPTDPAVDIFTSLLEGNTEANLQAFLAERATGNEVLTNALEVLEREGYKLKLYNGDPASIPDTKTVYLNPSEVYSSAHLRDVETNLMLEASIYQEAWQIDRPIRHELSKDPKRELDRINEGNGQTPHNSFFRRFVKREILAEVAGDMYIDSRRGMSVTVDKVLNSSGLKEIKMAALTRAGELFYGSLFNEYSEDLEFQSKFEMSYLDFLNSKNLEQEIRQMLMSAPFNLTES